MKSEDLRIALIEKDAAIEQAVHYMMEVQKLQKQVKSLNEKQNFSILFESAAADFRLALKRNNGSWEDKIQVLKKEHLEETQQMELKWKNSFVALQKGYRAAEENHQDGALNDGNKETEENRNSKEKLQRTCTMLNTQNENNQKIIAQLQQKLEIEKKEKNTLLDELENMLHKIDDGQLRIEAKALTAELASAQEGKAILQIKMEHAMRDVQYLQHKVENMEKEKVEVEKNDAFKKQGSSTEQSKLEATLASVRAELVKQQELSIQSCTLLENNAREIQQLLNKNKNLETQYQVIVTTNKGLEQQCIAMRNQVQQLKESSDIQQDEDSSRVAEMEEKLQNTNVEIQNLLTKLENGKRVMQKSNDEKEDKKEIRALRAQLGMHVRLWKTSRVA